MPLIDHQTLSQLREMGATRPASPLDSAEPQEVSEEIVPLRLPDGPDLVERRGDTSSDFPPWVMGRPPSDEAFRLDPDGLIDTSDIPHVVPDFAALRPARASGADERERGVEAYGWYRSFHLEPQEKWGIYMRDWGLLEIARKAFVPGNAQTGDNLDVGAAVAKAVRLLLLHECFHFVVDVAATSLELLQHSRDLSQGSGATVGDYRHWLDYFETVYLDGAGPGPRLEEGLANAYCFRHLRPKGRARTFMRNQPPGYCDFEAFLGDNFDPGLRQMAGRLAHPRNPDPAAGPTESIFLARDPWRVLSAVPIYLVQEMPSSLYTPRFIDRIPASTQHETEDFRTDLDRRPQLRKPVEKTRRLLDAAVRHGSLNFEKLKGSRVPPLFTVRVDRRNRLFLERRGEEWWLLRVGPHDLYRSMS